jgi:hypothetical protein
MNTQILRSLLTRQPFEPMRVKMSGGEVFDIRHAEMASLAKSGLIVVLAEPDESPSDRVEFCSLMHIVGVETKAFAA